MDSSTGGRQPRGKRSTPRWLWWGALTILALYGLFVLLLWRLGLLDFPETGDGQAFAAILGLLGGFFASSLTFLGLLLKHSLDQRNAQLAEETESRRRTESDRTQQLAEEAERRLKLEASIRAVDLLSTSEGKPASPTEQAGALFALAHLGQLDLAITLLSETWKKGGISTRAATSLIDQGLRDTSGAAIQILASRTMLAHAEALPDGAGGLVVPDAVDRAWPVHVPEIARYNLWESLLTALSSLDRAIWRQETLNNLLYTLDLARRKDQKMQAEATCALTVILEVGEFPPGGRLPAPTGAISIDDLRAEIEGSLAWANGAISAPDHERVNALRERWDLNRLAREG